MRGKITFEHVYQVLMNNECHANYDQCKSALQIEESFCLCFVGTKVAGVFFLLLYKLNSAMPVFHGQSIDDNIMPDDCIYFDIVTVYRLP